MKYDDYTIQKLRELSILDVATKLGFNLKGMGGEGRRALCPYHDDKHPSLHFSKKKGIFKCFVCGAKGDLFKLVMDTRNCTFVEACDWLVKEFNIIVTPSTNTKSVSTNTKSVSANTNNTNMKFSNWLSPSGRRAEPSQILDPEKNHSLDSCNSCSVNNHSLDSSNSCSEKKTIKSAFCPLPSDIVTRSLSLNSQFCKSVVSSGYLSESQLRNAAARYRLGCTKDGGVIFWEIDNLQQVHTGKIMYYQSDCHRDKQHNPTWVHTLMKDKLPQNYELQHCLFGLHLISNTYLTNPTNTRFSNWLSPSGRRAEPSLILDPVKIDSLDSCNSCSVNNHSLDSSNSCSVKVDSNTNLTNHTNKTFSNWLSPSGRRAEPSLILDPKKIDSLDSCNSCSVKNHSLDSCNSCSVKSSVVCIVESEKTAVIMSVICPECVWMSCGGLQMFKPELLAPLVNYKVVIFPDTDETGEAYKQWLAVLQQASQRYPFKHPLRISNLLEQHATPDQKSRKIDLIDFLFEPPSP